MEKCWREGGRNPVERYRETEAKVEERWNEPDGEITTENERRGKMEGRWKESNGRKLKGMECVDRRARRSCRERRRETGEKWS